MAQLATNPEALAFFLLQVACPVKPRHSGAGKGKLAKWEVPRMLAFATDATIGRMKRRNNKRKGKTTRRLIIICH